MNTTSMMEESPLLRLFEKPASEIIRFLEQTAWGCNGLQYFVKNYEAALERIPDPHFFVHTESGRIIGTVMFFAKSIQAGPRSVRCVYLTQLSVHPDSRGRGIAGRLVKAVVEHAQRQGPAGEPFLITAYIEEANAPSLAVFNKQNFHTLGTFHGTVINRIHPKANFKATRLERKDLAPLKTLLKELYADHALQDFESSVHTEDCRVLRDENGRIVAGLQEHLEEWKVTEMEGAGGWFVVNVLGKIPWFQEHLFNPASSRFVHIGNLYARPGHESALYGLIEDALARRRVPFAVGYFDKKSPVYQRLVSAGSLGLLNPVMETPVRVMAWVQGLSNEEITDLKRRCLVISPIDIS